jgi:hypothetical protein
MNKRLLHALLVHHLRLLQRHHKLFGQRSCDDLTTMSIDPKADDFFDVMVMGDRYCCAFYCITQRNCLRRCFAIDV